MLLYCSQSSSSLLTALPEGVACPPDWHHGGLKGELLPFENQFFLVSAWRSYVHVIPKKVLLRILVLERTFVLGHLPEFF